MKTQPLFIFIAGMMLCAGCARVPVSLPSISEPWKWNNLTGEQIRTEHYLIWTTVRDQEVLIHFESTMEAAWLEYQKLIPELSINDRVLECYLFANRTQWADYTITNTGQDAAIYLQMVQGGYTYRDRFVCYLGNEPDLYPIATHEGFHQFVARNFLTRLPPTLEEGLACRFEGLNIQSHSAILDKTSNPIREQLLSRAYEGKWLIPLDLLIQLHAGDLINQPSERIDGFYAQCWAFARMLQDNPEYKKGLQDMLTDCARGTVIHPIGPADNSGRYNPSAVRPMLEKYLKTDIKTLQNDYINYIQHLSHRQPSSD